MYVTTSDKIRNLPFREGGENVCFAYMIHLSFQYLKRCHFILADLSFLRKGYRLVKHSLCNPDYFF